MKPGRSRRLWRGCLALVTWAPLSSGSAQGSVGTEGGAFLLRPIGARAVGSGLAVVAGREGAESLWWNPAAIAWVPRREFALHHSQDFFATGDAITVIIPSSLLGVFGIAADLQNFGEQENTSDPSTPSTGTILTRSFVLSASYATTIGSRLATGLAFKVVQMRVDCTGPCDFPNEVAQTFAVDAGAQFELGQDHRVVLGASVRNLGLSLQVQDSQQADPLPSRLQVGVLYRYPLPERYAAESALNLSADLVDGLRIGRPLPRLGAEFAWQGQAFIRGGYVFEASDAEAGGPTLGLGFVRGSLMLDLARVFTGFSADAGQAPTYLSLRFGF